MKASRSPRAQAFHENPLLWCVFFDNQEQPVTVAAGVETGDPSI